MSPEKNLQDGKKPLIYENFMFKLDERLISDLVQALLENIIKQDSLPTIQQHNKTNLMSSFWSIMTLGYSTSQSNKDDASQETINYTDRLLALQSCHILLILSNYCTNDITFRNPFRLALFHFTDTQGKPSIISQGYFYFILNNFDGSCNYELILKPSTTSTKTHAHWVDIRCIQ